MMRKFIFGLLLSLPALAFAQYDFETRYFTVDATSLPELESLSIFSFESAPKTFGKLPTFKLTLENYREPVDMMQALAESQTYIRTSLEEELNATYGINPNKPYLSDGTTTVKNIVYKDAGMDLLSPCPPYGICMRCAPYRLNRGY